MQKENCKRKGCKDVFNSFLVCNSSYDGIFEIPIIRGTREIPNKLTVFSKAISMKNTDSWVHFYEDDVNFERIWNNPQKYVDILRSYRGVILPDFSLYRDMPLVMQLWNIYRSRAIGSYLERNEIKVIPNVRYGDERTYGVCCNGLCKNGTIAVGSHGTLKNTEDRKCFIAGLEHVIGILNPAEIIVYGRAPKKIFDKYKSLGITICQFESDYSISRKEVE